MSDKQHTLHSARRLGRLMSRYYLSSRYHSLWGPLLRRPLAWVTSGAPVEILRVFGIHPFYPENYGALCGARRASLALCQAAEARGYSQDLCSYARCHLGSLFSPEHAPLKKLPPPDLLVACNNICGTVLKWYEELARRLRVPLLFIDTPFIAGELEDRAVAYVQEQLRAMVEELSRLTGRRWDAARARRIMGLSNEAVLLWREIRYMGRHRPSPLNAPDLFIHMAPIVVLRGTPQAVHYYRLLLSEVRERVKKGIAAVPGERVRLLWDNIAIWYRLNRFFRFFAERGACFVTDTYTGGWDTEMAVREDPLESLAEAYAGIFLNRSLQFRVRQMVELIRDFAVDGFVMHSNRSCKPYSLVQEEIRRQVVEQTGIPGLVVEADQTDPRAFAEETVLNRAQAFLEALAL
ncbi:2-hydroxyacyl-CoA dehydratase subunit D [Desulfovirgula thermocuniculi]|uniref:2-hydroxyacyl-CoA dehydratase subunit D n=1 Tax=Desulfovirgula thermocuniculi TaxID=348842 RepID=UPI0003FF5BD4|nr:2-hydroxyacyl-CoA dehydratase family protein [Desulfovirgula thermocuniculi]